jgi:ABC-2 type transport system ATP-binding protein
VNDRTPSISARQLTRQFGDFTAVAGIDFDAFPGEIFGLLGPNGSGKTTTIRMTLGLLKPTSGSVSVLGIPAGQSPQQLHPRLGYMSQRFSLYNDLTVLQNLRFSAAAYGLTNRLAEERIARALAMAGLEGRESATTRDLSGGWRQRLALSATILHDPEVIVLDEPTAGVDPVSRRAFWDLLYELIARGVTIFITTHYMDEAEHCHRLAFLQHGTIIAYGTPSTIKSRTMSGPVLEIETSDPPTAVPTLRKAIDDGRLRASDVELYGSLIRIIAPDAEGLEATVESELAEAGVSITAAAVVEPSLEDVFIASMKAAPGTGVQEGLQGTKHIDQRKDSGSG